MPAQFAFFYGIFLFLSARFPVYVTFVVAAYVCLVIRNILASRRR